jgi:predicted MFS family arabinose efflux permease
MVLILALPLWSRPHWCRQKGAQAVGRVLLGLTVATIVGVPLANGMGRVYGWRLTFVVVAALALLCATLIAFADRALMPTAGTLLVGSAVVLAIYPFAAANFWSVSADVFLIGVGGALATVLQTRLMDVAGDAQSLAAALNHSAFNVANALGPWLGGMAIAAGFGLASTGYVGCALAVGGLAVWGISRSRSA